MFEKSLGADVWYMLSIFNSVAALNVRIFQYGSLTFAFYFYFFPSFAALEGFQGKLKLEALPAFKEKKEPRFFIC